MKNYELNEEEVKTIKMLIKDELADLEVLLKIKTGNDKKELENYKNKLESLATKLN